MLTGKNASQNTKIAPLHARRVSSVLYRLLCRAAWQAFYTSRRGTDHSQISVHVISYTGRGLHTVHTVHTCIPHTDRFPREGVPGAARRRRSVQRSDATQTPDVTRSRPPRDSRIAASPPGSRAGVSSPPTVLRRRLFSV